jgi:hypothetical protein
MLVNSFFSTSLRLALGPTYGYRGLFPREIADHSPTSAAKVVELYLHSPIRLDGVVLRDFTYTFMSQMAQYVTEERNNRIRKCARNVSVLKELTFRQEAEHNMQKGKVIFSGTDA